MIILSIGGGILAGVLVHFFISPYLKRKILREVYGGDKETTASPPQARTVSFMKSSSISRSEPKGNSEEKDIIGKWKYS